MYFNFLTKKIVTMKRNLLAFTICIIFQCSCTVIQDAPPGPPACDNTVADCTIMLDWQYATYLCTIGAFGILPPPRASAINYLVTPSVNGTIGSLSSPSSYLCQIISKNDQPSENPNLPCTKPGVLTSTWSVAGPSQNTKIYKNANTDITVDYYDICSICNGAISQGRPYFSGKVIVPKGAVAATIVMQTQNVYVGSPSPCE